MSRGSDIAVAPNLPFLGWLRRNSPMAVIGALMITSVGCNQHRSLTKQMGWQCIEVLDTGNPKFPHIEGIKMWFREDPHFEERASGPSLCRDLRRSGQADVAVTFDAWGFPGLGLRGYNIVGITIGSMPLTVWGSESGGFHGDPTYGTTRPKMHRFPLDVFSGSGA